MLTEIGKIDFILILFRNNTSDSNSAELLFYMVGITTKRSGGY